MWLNFLSLWTQKIKFTIFGLWFVLVISLGPGSTMAKKWQKMEWNDVKKTGKQSKPSSGLVKESEVWLKLSEGSNNHGF